MFLVKFGRRTPGPLPIRNAPCSIQALFPFLKFPPNRLEVILRARTKTSGAGGANIAPGRPPPGGAPRGGGPLPKYRTTRTSRFLKIVEWPIQTSSGGWNHAAFFFRGGALCVASRSFPPPLPDWRHPPPPGGVFMFPPLSPPPLPPFRAPPFPLPPFLFTADLPEWLGSPHGPLSSSPVRCVPLWPR